MSKYISLSQPVKGDLPKEQFLDELVAWLKIASDDIFARNNQSGDIYNRLKPILGPWPTDDTFIVVRKAAMGECLRVLARFESDWHFNEGVDITNAHSLSHKAGEETGAFQVSEDSIALDGPATDLIDCIKRYCGTLEVQKFIDTMKWNHQFAFEYCARLLRFSYAWDGPIKRGEVDRYLSDTAMTEFIKLLS